jgi:hypothetical protein
MESDSFVYAKIWQGLSPLHSKAQYHYLYSNFYYFQFPSMCEAFNRSGLGCERAHYLLVVRDKHTRVHIPVTVERARAGAHTHEKVREGGRVRESQSSVKKSMQIIRTFHQEECTQVFKLIINTWSGCRHT